MKNLKTLFPLPLLSIFLLFSCSKDEASPAGSRSVKYEITGNYSGLITLVVATNNGDFEALEVRKLPWKLEFIAKPSITFVGGVANGSDGAPGQTATLKTFVGGKEVSAGTGTALSSGFLYVTNKVHLLK